VEGLERPINLVLRIPGLRIETWETQIEGQNSGTIA